LTAAARHATQQSRHGSARQQQDHADEHRSLRTQQPQIASDSNSGNLASRKQPQDGEKPDQSDRGQVLYHVDSHHDSGMLGVHLPPLAQGLDDHRSASQSQGEAEDDPRCQIPAHPPAEQVA
jgi:hypothetical protein